MSKTWGGIWTKKNYPNNLSQEVFGRQGLGFVLVFTFFLLQGSLLLSTKIYIAQGTWSETKTDAPQCYRALRDIAPGEALSIDYLNFPAGLSHPLGVGDVLG